MIFFLRIIWQFVIAKLQVSNQYCKINYIPRLNFQNKNKFPNSWIHSSINPNLSSLKRCSAYVYHLSRPNATTRNNLVFVDPVCMYVSQFFFRPINISWANFKTDATHFFFVLFFFFFFFFLFCQQWHFSWTFCE